MEIACLSASNILHAGMDSTSLRICHLIGDMVCGLCTQPPNLHVIPLVECALNPCIGCGACAGREQCTHDPAFNRIFADLASADAVFIVSAHYAPIPAKLCMLLEKIEQLAFLKRFHNDAYRSPLFGKPVGIIGHGGGTEDIIPHYRGPVLDSIWNALSYPVEMRIVGADDDRQARGVVIPVKRVVRSASSVFPIQEYDWADIRDRIQPLVERVVSWIPCFPAQPE